ncbi:MAG TPA: hypothetical protein VHF91_07885 [Acidimicrobiales bacterium]|nr:hypothetical protein [Acidimicrobiales bacterium]
MQAEVGDRIVLHGRAGTRIGVVVEAVDDGGSKVHWADGGESVLSAASQRSEEAGRATWNAAKVPAGPAVTWRRGITAGLGREASLALEKLDQNAGAKEQEPEPAEPAEHKAAAGE